MAKPLNTQDPAKYGAIMEEIAEEIMSLKHQVNFSKISNAIIAYFYCWMRGTRNFYRII